MREKGFLNWYERWLREVIVGYNDEEIGFGMNLDGDPGQLMELYQQTEDPTLLIYAVWCTEGVENRQLQELYVELMDKYRTCENTKFDYKGSQMVLKGGACLGVSRPEGQLTSNLMRQFDYFGLDYRGGFKLLMDEDRWKEWIWGIVKVSERDFFYKSPPPNRRHVFRDAKCVRQTFMGDDAFSCRAHGVY